MKTAATIAACLSLLTCHFSHAQDTNQTARQRAAEVKHIDLNMELPDKLGRVLMSEQSTLYLVQVPVGGGSSFQKRPPPDVDSLGLQVWLLKKDGTAIPQRDKPARVGIGNAGRDTDYMIYTFNKGSWNELAGIVLQVKGKLYSHEIGPERK